MVSCPWIVYALYTYEYKLYTYKPGDSAGLRPPLFTPSTMDPGPTE